MSAPGPVSVAMRKSPSVVRSRRLWLTFREVSPGVSRDTLIIAWPSTFSQQAAVAARATDRISDC